MPSNCHTAPHCILLDTQLLLAPFISITITPNSFLLFPYLHLRFEPVLIPKATGGQSLWASRIDTPAAQIAKTTRIVALTRQFPFSTKGNTISAMTCLRTCGTMPRIPPEPSFMAFYNVLSDSTTFLTRTTGER